MNRKDKFINYWSQAFFVYQGKLARQYISSSLMAILIISAHFMMFVADLFNDANRPDEVQFELTLFYKGLSPIFSATKLISPIDQTDFATNVNFYFAPVIFLFLVVFIFIQVLLARYSVAVSGMSKNSKSIYRLMIKASSRFLVLVYWLIGYVIMFINNELLIIYAYAPRDMDPLSNSAQFAIPLCFAQVITGTLVAISMEVSYLMTAQHLLVKKNPMAYVFSWNPLPFLGLLSLLHLGKCLFKYIELAWPHMFASFIYFNLFLLGSIKMHRFFDSVSSRVFDFWVSLIFSLNISVFMARLKNVLFENFTGYPYPEPLLIFLVAFSFSYKALFNSKAFLTKKMYKMFSLKSMTPQEIILFLHHAIETLGNLRKKEESLFWISLIEHHRAGCETFQHHKRTNLENTRMPTLNTIGVTQNRTVMRPRRESLEAIASATNTNVENKKKKNKPYCFCTNPTFSRLDQLQDSEDKKEKRSLKNSVPHFDTMNLLRLVRKSLESAMEGSKKKSEEKARKKADMAYLHISYSYFLYEYFSNATIAFLYLNVATRQLIKLSMKEQLLMKNIMDEINRNQIKIMSESHQNIAKDIEDTIMVEKQFFSTYLKKLKEVINTNSDIWEILNKNSKGKDAVLSFNQRLVRSPLFTSFMPMLDRHSVEIESMKTAYNQLMEISPRYTYAIKVYALFKLFVLNDETDSVKLSKSVAKLIMDQARYDMRPLTFKIDRYLSPKSVIFRTSGLQETFGQILWVNINAASLLKCKSKNELIGQSFKKFMPRSIGNMHDIFVNNYYHGSATTNMLFEMRRGYILNNKGYLLPIIMYVKPFLQISGTIQYSAFYYLMESSNEQPIDYILTFKDGRIDSMTKSLYKKMHLSPIVTEACNLDINDISNQIRGFYAQIIDFERGSLDKKKKRMLFDQEIKGNIKIDEGLRRTLKNQIEFVNVGMSRAQRSHITGVLDEDEVPENNFGNEGESTPHNHDPNHSRPKDSGAFHAPHGFNMYMKSLHEDDNKLIRIPRHINETVILNIRIRPKLFKTSMESMYAIVLEVRNSEAKTEVILKEAEEGRMMEREKKRIEKYASVSRGSPVAQDSSYHLKKDNKSSRSPQGLPGKSVNSHTNNNQSPHTRRTKIKMVSKISSSILDKKTDKAAYKKELASIFNGAKKSSSFAFTPSMVFLVIFWLLMFLIAVSYAYVGLELVSYGIDKWDLTILRFKFSFKFFDNMFNDTMPFYAMNLFYEETQTTLKAFRTNTFDFFSEYLNWQIDASYSAYMEKAPLGTRGRYWFLSNCVTDSLEESITSLDPAEAMIQPLEFIHNFQEILKEGLETSVMVEEYRHILGVLLSQTAVSSGLEKVDVVELYSEYLSNGTLRSEIMNGMALVVICVMITVVVIMVMYLDSKITKLVSLFFSNSSDVIRRNYHFRSNIKNNILDCIENDFDFNSFLLLCEDVETATLNVKDFSQKPQRHHHHEKTVERVIKRNRSSSKDFTIVNENLLGPIMDSVRSSKIGESQISGHPETSISNLLGSTRGMKPAFERKKTINLLSGSFRKSHEELEAAEKLSNSSKKTESAKGYLAWQCIKYLCKISSITYLGIACVFIIIYSEYLYRRAAILTVDTLRSLDSESQSLYDSLEDVQLTLESIRDIACPHIVSLSDHSLCSDGFDSDSVYTLKLSTSSSFHASSFISAVSSNYQESDKSVFDDDFCEIFNEIVYLAESSASGFKSNICDSIFNDLGVLGEGISLAYSNMIDDFSENIIQGFMDSGFIVDNPSNSDSGEGLVYTVKQRSNVTSELFYKTDFQKALYRYVFLAGTVQFLLFDYVHEVILDYNQNLFFLARIWRIVYYVFFLLEIVFACFTLVWTAVTTVVRINRYRSMMRLFPDSIIKHNDQILLFLGGKKLHRLALDAA